MSRVTFPVVRRHTAKLVLVMILSFSLAGCRGAKVTEEEEEPAPAAPVPVQAVQVMLSKLKPTVDLVGTLQAIPERTAVISSRTSGWIETVHVVAGQDVEKECELVTFDCRVAEIEYQKAAAAVAEKEATLARLKRGYLPQEIEGARDELERANRQLESLDEQLTALVPLWKQKEVPDLQYRQAQSAVHAAQAGRDAAEAKLKLLEAGTPAEEIAEAEAQLGTAQAVLDGAELNLEFCHIKCPISGTVTQLTARQGMFVDQAAALLTVADLSRLFLEIRVPLKYAAQVSAGARVDVAPTGLAESSLPATIARIAAEADASTGDVVALVGIQNDNGRLRPGMTCRACLSLTETPATPVVPVAAISDRSGTPVVTVVRDGKAHEIEVQLGDRTDHSVAVTKGLEPGNWVVTRGGYGLPDGCPVKIVEGPSPTPPAAVGE